jgi:hypothetical protein
VILEVRLVENSYPSQTGLEMPVPYGF